MIETTCAACQLPVIEYRPGWRCPRCNCDNVCIREIHIHERIACAAIWVDDGHPAPWRPHENYPETGILFCGRGHGDCFVSLKAWESLLHVKERDRIGTEQLDGKHSGFQTSTGRFVDRVEAAAIAWLAGQIDRQKDSLDSEDLKR